MTFNRLGLLLWFAIDMADEPMPSATNKESGAGASGKGVISSPEEWVELYGDFLYRYALIRVRNPDVAEDLVQETLLAAIKSKGSYTGQSSEGGWLTGIMRHKIMDHFRRLNRDRVAVPAEDELPDELKSRFDEFGHWKSKGAGPTDWGSDAATLMERKEFMVAFKKCLAKLPSRTAEAFVLREMDGVESDAIQEVLGVSASNFWVLLHRARMQLRQCIEINWIKS